MCRSVVQLDSLDTANVVMVSSILRIAGRRRESRFRDELVSLRVEVICDVGAKKAVDEGSLGFIVMTQGCSTLSS